jgi:hypothetical protein
VRAAPKITQKAGELVSPANSDEFTEQLTHTGPHVIIFSNLLEQIIVCTIGNALSYPTVECVSFIGQGFIPHNLIHRS